MLETVKILGEIVFKITNGFGTIIFLPERVRKTMKRALLLYDEKSRFDAAPDAVAKVFEDLYDGLFAIDTKTDYKNLTYEDLKAYHAVILAMQDLDANGSKDFAGALISYTADGGSLLFLADALKADAFFELHCLTASKCMGDSTTMLLDISPAGDHVITERTEPFLFIETPYFYEPDPLYETDTLLNMTYAGKPYPIAWCHKYGWGKVACFGFGMVPETYLPPVRRILWRTGEWFLDRV